MPAKKKTEVIEAAEGPPVDKSASSSLSEIGRIMQSAISQNASIDTLERVMKLYEHSQAIAAKQQFNESFAKFQREMPVVKKSKTASFATKHGGRMEYTYASIDDVVSAVQPILHRFGLSYWFEQQQQGPSITITCRLGHVSGHSISNTATGPLDTSGLKSPLQQIASSATFLKRQTLVSILGLACTDDDTDGYVPDVNSTASTDRPDAANTYPDEKFQTMLPTWQSHVNQGKSLENMINMVNSSATPMTPQQVTHLKNLQPQG